MLASSSNKNETIAFNKNTSGSLTENDNFMEFGDTNKPGEDSQLPSYADAGVSRDYDEEDPFSF